tara:strand:+ start:154 stop:279 length:126 start_codon:yes stop_codon:yes gene_type:complete
MSILVQPPINDPAGNFGAAGSLRPHGLALQTAAFQQNDNDK